VGAGVVRSSEMTDREPKDEEVKDPASKEEDVEGHGVGEEDEGEGAFFDVNVACA
jgi:hypothetical protein